MYRNIQAASSATWPRTETSCGERRAHRRILQSHPLYLYLCMGGSPRRRSKEDIRVTSFMRLCLLALCAFITLAIIQFLRSPARTTQALSSPAAPPAGPLYGRRGGKNDYCSAPASGDEGYEVRDDDRKSPEGGDDRKLRAVAIVIRHGDRSAIHSIPNATGEPAVWRCLPTAREGLARREWPALRANFVVRTVTDGARLERSLRSATQVGSSNCEPGQLTPRGFEQHVRLGRHLSNAYAPLLDALAANVSSYALDDVAPTRRAPQAV